MGPIRTPPILPKENPLLLLLALVVTVVVLTRPLSPPLTIVKTKKVTTLFNNRIKFNNIGAETLKVWVKGTVMVQLVRELTCVKVIRIFTVAVSLPFPNYPVTTPEIATLVILVFILKTEQLVKVINIFAPQLNTLPTLNKAVLVLVSFATVQHLSVALFITRTAVSPLAKWTLKWLRTNFF